MKKAIVTGASSGIGYELCRQLLAQGYRVYGFSRRGTGPAGCIGVKLDVTDAAAVRVTIQRIMKEEGTMDLLINNAGMGISGPVEYTSEEDAHRIMDVNFFGYFHCAKAILPYMRAQRSGCIVFVSSVAAPVAIPYQSFYSAGKAAVNGLALGLRNELRGTGVEVCVMMPGDISTGFTAARKKQDEGAAAYPHCNASVASMEKDEISGMTPAYAANVILKAAQKKHPRPLTVVGTKYKFLYLLIKFLPASLVYKLVGILY